jgi:prephenate dehydrogenase
VLANVLVAQAAAAYEREDAGAGRGSIPPSLADAIRVAGSNTAIWTDIYPANRLALQDAIDETVRGLQAVHTALAQGDAAALATWNDDARDARDALLGENAP